MFEDKKFDLCRYYSDNISVFVDGTQKNGDLYLILQIVDTINKDSKFQTFIFPKDTFKSICQGHKISWFIQKYYGLTGITQLVNYCKDNNLSYKIVKEKLL